MPRSPGRELLGPDDAVGLGQTNVHPRGMGGAQFRRVLGDMGNPGDRILGEHSRIIGQVLALAMTQHDELGPCQPAFSRCELVEGPRGSRQLIDPQLFVGGEIPLVGLGPPGLEIDDLEPVARALQTVHGPVKDHHIVAHGDAHLERDFDAEQFAMGVGRLPIDIALQHHLGLAPFDR